jgi:hypothetical protein
LKSISIAWSSGVQDEEAVQSLAAVVGMFTALYHRKWPMGILEPLVSLRPFGNWVIPALPEGHPYSSFEWYVESAAQPGQEALDGEQLLDIIEREPWQQQDHHYDLCLVHLPIWSGAADGEMPFVVRPGVAGVISADWLRAYGEVGQERLALRRLCFHAMGLVMGLAPHFDQRSTCAMRPFSGREELLRLAEEEHESKAVFCDEHYTEMLSLLLNGRGPLN